MFRPKWPNHEGELACSGQSGQITKVNLHVPAKVAKNFFVTDTYLEIPPAGLSKGAYEHRDPHDPLASFNGLGVVPDEIKSLLPPECREAFDTALDHETEWKSRWGAESKTMSRREPVIDKAIVPYSMS